MAQIKQLCFSAPGGTLSDDMTRTEFCLFKAQEDMETMQAYAQASESLVYTFFCSIFVKSFPCHTYLKKKYLFSLGLQQTDQALQIFGERI